MHAELLQDMINLLAYAISSRGSTVEELLDMLNYEFSNDSMYPTGDDPVSEYPEEVKSAFSSANDGVMYDDYLRYLSGSVQRSSLDNQMENTMRITETKLRRMLRTILLEAQGDGLSDPEVAAAYEELADMGFPDNVDRSDFAVDTDMSFLDDWPYSEALEIMHTQEGSYDDFEYGDTDEERYAEREASMRARQNRGMYEGWRRIIREFGEDDAQLRQKLQNREKMIGRGVDMGTIGFDPNWDYASNRPLRPKKMHRLEPELQMVADMIRGGGIGDNLELMPGRNGGPPDMFYFTMVGSGIRARCDYQSYNVQKNHPEFTGEGCFISTQDPDAVKGAFEEGAETTDPADIERVLENFIDFAENNTQEDSVWMTFAPAS